MNSLPVPSPAGERGATVFIVLLVLTLLTTITLFAVRSATLVTVASGNARQAAQSLYFAEGANALGVAQIGGPQATLYVDLIYTSQDQCQINAAINGTASSALGTGVIPPCYRIFDSEVKSRVLTASGGKTDNIFEPQTAAEPGTLGPVLPTYNEDVTDSNLAINSGREGRFVIELTDAFEGPPPAGFNVDDSAFRSVTVSLTTFSQVRNTPNQFTTAAWCGTRSSANSASVQAVRAYVTLPMVAK
ncbi:MAG: hypothetical protein JW751_13945 [Polyangiaceae bacterium]|nr:hypothetical protein [Polyangiaceae bacterium]